MDRKQKYVRLKEYNEVIIFPCIIEHSKFRSFGVHSAEFCYVDEIDVSISCFGESISLNLESDPQDSFYATKQVFGWDRAKELLNQNING